MGFSPSPLRPVTFGRSAGTSAAVYSYRAKLGSGTMSVETKKLVLPEAPGHLTGPVKAWSQPVVIPTYPPQPPDVNPMFLEKRVYQGSSGKVYPLPFYNRISEEKVEQSWDALHIENQYIRVMVLPQLGGRIHVAMDKTNGYDFIYRQNVIKPALVGLSGPWPAAASSSTGPSTTAPAPSCRSTRTSNSIPTARARSGSASTTR